MKFALNHKRLFNIGLPILLVFSLLVNIGVAIYVQKATRTTAQIAGEQKQFRDELMALLLAEKTEKITKYAETDQKKAIAVARWVAANISNREPLGHDDFGWFAYRSGQCSARATIYVKMLSYLHLPAKIFNMYNFGGGGAGGHSNAQVFYDGAWHYFDVTYAGYFINDEGVVMSWDDIVEDPDYALKHMVIFDETNDRYGNLDQDTVERLKVSNIDRMKVTYTIDNIRNEKSYGFYPDGKLKVLYPQVNASELPQNGLSIGKIDESHEDVDIEGIQQDLSQNLGSLGTMPDHLQFQWNFVNCEPGKEYVIEYYLNKASQTGLKFWVNVSGGQLLEGGQFLSNVADVIGKNRIWSIRFKADEENCSVYVGYDFEENGKYLSVDQIKIGACD